MTAYVPQSARETLTRISEGTSPWVAIGDFVDDWHRSDGAARRNMMRDPLSATDSNELHRWAALIAASVDWLARTSEPRLRVPGWVTEETYVLHRPWFLYHGWRLRMHQLVDTPAPFKLRNI